MAAADLLCREDREHNTMRDYQPYKNNKYLLPKTLYKRTLALIRDYYRMKEEHDSIGEGSPPPPDGMPRGTATGNPTERDGIRRALLKTEINAIEKAWKTLPEEYRNGVWHNIMGDVPYPDDADRVTYSRHKQRFIYQVAKNMFWI